MSKLQQQVGREVTFTGRGTKGLIVDTKVLEDGNEYAVIQTTEGDNSRHCYEADEYKLCRR